MVGDNVNDTAISYRAQWTNKGNEILIYGWGGLLDYPETEGLVPTVRVLFEYFGTPSAEEMPPAFSLHLAYKLAEFAAPKWRPEMVKPLGTLVNSSYVTAVKQDAKRIAPNQISIDPPSDLIEPSFNRSVDPTYFNYPGEPDSSPQ